MLSLFAGAGCHHVSPVCFGTKTLTDSTDSNDSAISPGDRRTSHPVPVPPAPGRFAKPLGVSTALGFNVSSGFAGFAGWGAEQRFDTVGCPSSVGRKEVDTILCVFITVELQCSKRTKGLGRATPALKRKTNVTNVLKLPENSSCHTVCGRDLKYEKN